ncbi:thioredoxin family protein [Chitinophaga sp.]|uniref:thioredoxin family protein n=1 Tax=Chitinophaga sp. TaxID=1869181 RepID=UPI0031D8AEB2
MTFKDYCDQFELILNRKNEEQQAPYDNPHYLDYTKLNWTRMNRWFKTGKLTPEFTAAIQHIDAYQHWIIITEPWCGDAAHIIPFLEMASHLNPLIKVTYELRDTEPFRINQYLTNNGKSIPKLIIRNAEGYDLATWGPRPKDCQALYMRLTAEKADYDTVKMELQKWYNANKGHDLQTEMTELLRKK